MTATSPPPGAGQPAVQPQASGPPPATGVGDAVLLVGTRIGLWLGVQLGLAGLLVLVGGAAAFGQTLDEVASWWMVYMALVDLGTLGVIFWLLRRDGGSYRGLLGPPTSAWPVVLGAARVLAASVPAAAWILGSRPIGWGRCCRSWPSGTRWGGGCCRSWRHRTGPGPRPGRMSPGM